MPIAGYPLLVVEEITISRLDVLIKMISRLEDRGIAVQARRCTRLRHRIATCTRCSDVCPTAAIQWGESTLEVNPAKCTGCGACATVCPTSALSAVSPNDTQLSAAVEAVGTQGRSAIFICGRYLKLNKRAGAGAILVPCIARVDESIMIGAVAAGSPGVQLVEGACGGCPQGAAHKLAETTVTAANALLEGWGKPDLVQLMADAALEKENNPPKIAQAGEVSRRGLFMLLRGKTAEVASGAIANVAGTAILSSDEIAKESRNQVLSLADYPRLVPGKRRYLLASLARLGKPVGPEAETAFWANVRIGETCVGCHGCVDFCPSGALAKFENGDKSGIAFRSARCTGCHLCEEICHKAMRNECLQISQTVRWEALLQEETTIVMLDDKRDLIDPAETMQDKLSKLLGAPVTTYSA
jgi:ferredoxin